MNRLNYAVVLAAGLAVLTFAHGGWLVKAGVAACGLTCFAIYARRQKLGGLSLYLCGLFLLYLYADILTFADFSLGALLSYMIFCVSLGGCIVLARQGGAMLQVFTILTNTVFIVLPAFYLTHYAVFSAGVTRDVYHGMLQTNLAEAVEFARTTGIAEHLPVPILVIALITFLLCRYLRQEKIIRARPAKVFMLLTLVAATGWSGTAKRAPDTGPRVTRDLGLYTIRYYNRLRLFKRHTAQRDIGQVNYSATKTGKGETYLVVIGETLNRHHLQIYGYPRRTTPRLAAEQELLIFTNTYSSHIHTAHALAKALTAANQYNGMEWFTSVSIVDILRMAKIKTSWVSNQNLFSFFINPITLFAQNTDYHHHVGDAFYDSPHHDEVLLPHIDSILAQDTGENRVVFAHLLGNHADYCLRFTAEYGLFEGKLSVATHGRAADGDAAYQQVINCYDNSVLYNDFIVSTMLSMIKKRKGVNGFIYFSDHAVDVLADRDKVMHNYSYEMTSIPMVAWFSQAYRKKYPQAYQNLQNNRDKLFSNDLLYDTLIGIMAINTNQYNPRADLSSSDYQLKEEEALVLNGERKYDDKENKKWQQHKHIAALIAAGDGSRAIPARVNSVGELQEVWRDGCRSFAIDLTDNDTCLTVGRSEMCWQEFLSHVDTSKIDKLWLNVKIAWGGGTNNLPKIITSHVPTAKIIVDIGTCSDDSKILAQHGWQLSCVLSPALLQSLATEDTAALLAQQLTQQRVTAISFEARFYPQVKAHLEHLLPAGFVFHLRSPAAVGEVRHAAYWSDPRVETVAFRYHSLFQLPTKSQPKTYAAKKLPRP